MRVIIQRAAHAAVSVGGVTVGAIAHGLVVFLGVCENDTPDDALYLVEKCVGLRIFTDDNDKMNLSLADVDGALLIVSNFTLYGDCRKGKRPNFMRAAQAEIACSLYEQFVKGCRAAGFVVATGEFGADMHVELVNDGPVTIFMDTADMRYHHRNAMDMQ